MNKNKKKKIDKSILEWLPFKEVWNDLLYLDNDKVVGIIKVNSINLQLYSNEEQTSKIFQFRKVLLSLEYPFKILALDKPISLSEHIENLLYLSKNTDDKIKKELLEEDIKYADTIMNNNLVNNREFYLLIDEDKDNVKLLKSKINDIVSQLSNIGLSSSQAKTDEIKELLFVYLNPTSSLEVFRQDSSLKTLKEKIAPIAMKFNEKDILLGDIYATSIIIDTFPSYARGSWLGMLSNIKNTRMMISVNPMDNIEVNKTLKKGMTETRSKFINSKDRNDQIVLKNQLEDYEKLTNKMDRENEKMLLMSVVFFTYAESLEELQKRIKEIKSALSSLNLRGSQLIFEQEQGLKTCLPTLDMPLQENFGLPMPTTTVAASFPFVFESIQDDGNSIILGDDINGGLTLFDLWKRTNKRTNSNMCIIGKSGSGKSTLIKKLLRGNFARGGGKKRTRILCVDPEREYKDLCNTLNGNWIDCGSGSRFVINPLEIKNSANDEDNNVAVIKHLQTFRTFIKYYFKDLTELELTKIEELLLKTYKKKNITFNDKTLYKKGKFKITKDMPILEDLYNNLNDEKTKKFKIKLIPFIKGSLKFFNNYTNIELNKKLIIADVYELGEENMKYGMYLFTELFWDKIKINRKIKKAIYLDEIWRLIGVTSNKEVAKFIYKIFKTIRKYGGSSVAITQDISDLFSLENGTYGKSILNNSSIKTFFSLEEENIKVLSQYSNLSEKEKIEIKSLRRGECLTFVGDEHILINIEASDFEKEIIEEKNK